MGESYADVLNRIIGILHWLGKLEEARMMQEVSTFLNQNNIGSYADMFDDGQPDSYGDINAG